MKLFISHASHDKWVAHQISSLLQADGHVTFLDEKDIKSGESVDESIQANLKESDHLILLLSPASIVSQWVFIELGGAKALGLKIVPVLFHVDANEIPSAISQLLARDINEFDKYREELLQKPKAKSGKQSATGAQSPAVKRMVGGTFDGLSVGDRVRVVEVERLTATDKDTSPKWVGGMDKFSGVETRVIGFCSSGEWVALSADEGDFFWNREWISKID